jgi:hypothetical protein
MLASASDAARQDAAFKEAYRQAFLHMSDLLKASIGPRTVEDDHIELVVSAAMIGVVATARALKESAPDVSDTLMTAARKIFSRLVEPEC